MYSLYNIESEKSIYSARVLNKSKDNSERRLITMTVMHLTVAWKDKTKTMLPELISRKYLYCRCYIYIYICVCVCVCVCITLRIMTY